MQKTRLSHIKTRLSHIKTRLSRIKTCLSVIIFVKSIADKQEIGADK